MRPPAIVAAAVVLAAGLGRASAAVEPDSWTRVPALPTGCYQQDGFAEKLESARERLEQDLDRQEKTNQELSAKVRTIDPMELASRQQQYMMEHPQEAMQLMQRNQEIGQTFSDAEVESENERQAFEHELEAIDARYAEALDRELAPIKAKFADLDRRALADPIRTEAGDFYREWAVKEWNALAAQENAAYEKIGAEWWAVSGPFHGWLERYREHLAKRVPPREEVENVGAGFMVQLVGTPSATFKPTASLRAADEFMNQAAQVLAKRRAGPLKPMESSEGGAPRR